MESNKITLQNWLDVHFDHRYEYGQFLDIDPIDLPPKQHIIYMTQAFEDADNLLEPYSNGQLNQGLWYLVGEMHDLSDRFGNGVSWEVRQRCIQSFKSLNRKLFAQRCANELSAYREPGPDNPLNMICYMWWDSFAFWESLDSHSVNRVDAAFLDVMSDCLSVNHLAVMEGALHGLSHIPNHRKQVQKMIDDFLKQNPKLPQDLKNYAIASKSGMNL